MSGRGVFLLGIGVFAALSLTIKPTNADIIVTFEEGLGYDGEEINTQYEGLTFQSAGSGIPWVYGDATTGNYNVSSWPSGEEWGTGEYWINDYVCTWTTESGSDGMIALDNQDATFVQINYSAYNDFYIEAYNADDELLDMDIGPPNLRYYHGNEDGPGTVYVEADSSSGETIAYVLLHDEGNYWCVDNLWTDATVGGPGDLQIIKFNDLDEDGTWDENEPFLEGWEFHVVGPDYDEWFTTDNDGLIEIQDLDQGEYTVTETVQPGWTCTTENPQDVIVEEDLTTVARFGNVSYVSPSVYLFLIPDTDTIPCGDQLGYTVNIVNESNETHYFWFGTQVTMPDGTLIRPFLGPIWLTILPQETLTGYVTHRVCCAIPSGDYEYCGAIGGGGMGIWDTACFEVTVISEPGAFLDESQVSRARWETTELTFEGKSYLSAGE